MNPDLLARRDRAAQRHDRALERWPDRVGPGFAAELDAVIAELRSLCAEVDPTRDGAAEVARSWRWLGDAHFDRARGIDRAQLELGRDCYQRAEAIQGGTADVNEKAKLEFNFANTLRGLSGGWDVDLLRQAEARYRRALEIFRPYQPNAMQTCEAALATLMQQLRMAEQAAQVAAGQERLKDIEAQLKAGDEAGARSAWATFKKERSSPEAIGQGLLRELDQAAALCGLPQEHVADVKQRLRQDLSTLQRPDQQDSMMTGPLELLDKRLHADIAAGKIAPERQRALHGVMAELRDLAAEQPHEDIAAMAAWSTRLRSLMARFQDMAANPSSPPAASQGAERLVARTSGLKSAVMAEAMQPHRSSGEAEVAGKLLVELARLGTDAVAIGDDKAAIAVERDRLRPLALQWRNYALRHTALLARPLRWTCESVMPEASAVAYVGSAALRPTIAAYCRQRGLRLLEQGNRDAAHAAWDWARRAAVVVAQLEGERGPAWAPACYQLGLALCAGAAVVLLKDPTAVAPFDLDVPPIDVTADADIDAALADRIDAALYRRPALGAGSGSTLTDTLAVARRMLTRGQAPIMLGELRGDAEADPVHVQSLIQHAIGLQGRDAPLLLMPPLPLPYPDPQQPCCFHVTPFQPEKDFKPVRAAARAACGSMGLRYLHGDEAADRRILRAIWTDIARSEHVLVDLTGLNPNVAFELGIAHALGRCVHCIQRQPEGDAQAKPQTFPAITDERITIYDAGATGLREAIAAELAVAAKAKEA